MPNVTDVVYTKGAQTLALTLWKAKDNALNSTAGCMDQEDLLELLHRVSADYTASDEQAADLYARIADGLDESACATFPGCLLLITRSLRANRRIYG